MTERLPALFLRNRYLLVLSISVALVAGASALQSLPRQEDPRIANRNPFVITSFPGASAERVETLVTEPLERALDELAEVKTIESFSRSGVSFLNIELVDAIGAETNEQVFSKIRDKLGDAILPEEALPPFFDDRRDPSAFTMILGLTWEGEEAAELGLLNRLAEELADRLRKVDGTELVRIYGEPEEEITVTVDPDELAALRMTPSDVAARLRAADSKLPAGVLRAERSNLLLEVAGELQSTERIADVPLIADARGALVRVGDVAQVERAWRDPAREVALVDGRRSVLVAARMDTGLRIDRWGAAADVAVEGFAAELGRGVALDRVFDQQRYTSARLVELAGNLVAGALVVVVIVLFMMGWRSALIVGSALPLTVSLTLFAMQMLGGAIHQISIYGIIVALGLLIDNAIVVTDDVGKLLRKGATRLDAVQQTVGHLFWPLAASTATTVLAFAPIVLLPGSVGDFVGDIGRSVILALVFSFLVAMTIIAALAGTFGTRGEAKGGWLRQGLRSEALARRYRAALRWAMQLPVAAILLATLLPVAGFVVARSLGNEFFPPVDRNMFHVRVWLPSESSIEETLAEARRIESAMRDHEGIEQVHWMLGGSFPSVYYNVMMNQDDVPSYAHAILVTESAARTASVIPELQRDLDARFPSVQIVARSFGQGPPVDADIELRLFGPSLVGLREVGDRVRQALQRHPDVLHSQASIQRSEPKLWLDADEDEVRLAGLTLGGVAGRLQASLEGGFGGSILEELESVPVRVRFGDARRSELAEIASTPLAAPGGGWVSLDSLGELGLKPALGAITRYDGRRTQVIKGYTADSALPIDVTQQVLDELEASGFVLPAGYSLELGGAAEADSNATGNLLIYVPVLATLMVSILVLAFRSVRLAALLGVVAFLSAGLGLLATWSISFPISFNTFLGILGLIGVAFNDSIVVIAAIRANPAARAVTSLDAVVDEIVGTTRHIVSTTLTTIGGFLPLLLFVGGDFWPGLAIVLVGGVVGAMVLALLMIPAAYVLIFAPRERARALQEVPA